MHADCVLVHGITITEAYRKGELRRLAPPPFIPLFHSVYLHQCILFVGYRC